ncbi:hypothetical protein D3C87_2044970 [compost metagenome]
MNKNLFSAEEGFYKNGDGTTLDFPQMTNTLLALQELHPHLNSASQTQLSLILRPWIQSLEQLQ